MRHLSRRRFFAAAAAIGAAAAWAGESATSSHGAIRERRDLFPEGVASGDPDAHSVLLWTRRPFSRGSSARLRVEVADDEGFARVVATASVRVLAASDWTCRVLVGNLKPAQVYWYRFIDAEGNVSRTGRTSTALTDDDARPVRFAFVSCQDINVSATNAYRRMILEDDRVPQAEQLQFVLHLGDFIYELVWYPQEQPDRQWRGRPVREVVRYAHGERIADESLGTFHIPTTLDDYRAVYRAYLRDPNIQDARARWPFICIWDNHEFSSFGWQSFQRFNGADRPAQTRKVAALQAWFEFQPARVAKASGPSLDTFEPPLVRDVPIERFDDHGFGDEPNNRAAVGSLTAYRALRWGKHLDVVLTDQWSYRSEAAHTLLGALQKKWLLDRLGRSRATWKVWGNSLGTLEGRFEPRNLPTEPGAAALADGDFASLPMRDYSNFVAERAEIYERVREDGVTGFVTLSGDRHSFWAGLAAPALPPRPFSPVGVAFVTGSISGLSMFESMTLGLPREHPWHALNVSLRHGSRSALEYLRSGDTDSARRLSNPLLAPHLRFLDTAGHGFSTVRVTPDAFECEFVCIVNPIQPSASPEGAPLRYRIVHRVPMWKAGEMPQLEQRLVEGEATESLVW